MRAFPEGRNGENEMLKMLSYRQPLAFIEQQIVEGIKAYDFILEVVYLLKMLPICLAQIILKFCDILNIE